MEKSIASRKSNSILSSGGYLANRRELYVTETINQIHFHEEKKFNRGLFLLCEKEVITVLNVNVNFQVGKCIMNKCWI